MDQSPEAKAQAAVLTRALEAIGTKLQEERGFTGEQVALAMIAAGVNGLSQAWDGQQVVDTLAGITGAMMATHGIEPSGEMVARGQAH